MFTLVPLASIELAADLVWLRGLNFTHFMVIVVFYLLWRLPGPPKESASDIVWYDAVECLPPVESDDSEDDAVPFEDEAFLSARVKESTAAERLRFFVAKGRDRVKAVQALRVYTDWRIQHELALDPARPSSAFLSARSRLHKNEIAATEVATDKQIWDEVSLIALKVRKEQNCHHPLPQIAYLHQNTGKDICDKAGKRILHFIPGQMDDRIASTVTYALAVALYVNRLMDRDSTELVTVVIDTRGGHGWRNLNAAQLLPFIQHLSKLMLTMFPQRLYRALVFPIPSRFFWVWRMARNCIDVDTREKICPLMGPSTIDSEPPMEQIAEYLGRENAVLLEAKRKASFLSE